MLPLKIASSGGKWWPEELDKGVAGRVHGSSVDYTMCVTDEWGQF